MNAAERASCITDLEHYARELSTRRVNGKGLSGNVFDFSTPLMLAKRLQRIAELLKLDAESVAAVDCPNCLENVARARNYRAVVWAAARACYPQPLRVQDTYGRAATCDNVMMLAQADPASEDMLITAFHEGETTHENPPSAIALPPTGIVLTGVDK